MWRRGQSASQNRTGRPENWLRGRGQHQLRGRRRGVDLGYGLRRRGQPLSHTVQPGAGARNNQQARREAA